MEQQILALDSQILNTYAMCERKCKYAFIDRITPMVKAEALDKGGLLHELLKVHYIVKMKDFARLLNIPTFQPLVAELLIKTVQGANKVDFTPLDLEELQDMTIQGIVKRHYDYVSTQSDLPIEICEEVYKTYLQYAQYYENDGWLPIAVEQSFSKVLFESESVKILYEGIIDWLDEHKIVDHKSSSRRGEPLSLSNQFMGYAWAFGVHNVVINKVGFQKTLDAKDKFERYTKSYPNSLIEEWKANTIRTALELMVDVQNVVEMEKKFDLTSCDKYGGCIYTQVCETEPEARPWKMQTNYKIGEVWSPAKELEK
jgi:hypothetical protein